MCARESRWEEEEEKKGDSKKKKRSVREVVSCVSAEKRAMKLRWTVDLNAAVDRHVPLTVCNRLHKNDGPQKNDCSSQKKKS